MDVFILLETLMLVLGVLIGIALTMGISRIRSIGCIRIDKSDPDDGPYLFLELDREIKTFENCKYVSVRVKRKDFVPHK